MQLDSQPEKTMSDRDFAPYRAARNRAASSLFFLGIELRPLCFSSWLQTTLSFLRVADPFVLRLEVLDGLGWVHVEDGLADRQPLTALEEEHSGGIAQVADGGQSFHVTALDGLKLHRDTNQGGQLASLALAGELDAALEITGFPAQAARLAGGGGGAKEPGFQPLALQDEQFAGAFDLDLPAE
ncbi:MAG TPA: hypothetical protein VG013_20870 [Gemmataceae bacterium]|jgi:hypothetical protein|nr:hypothetical protein [Gemmataceae bacterium]